MTKTDKIARRKAIKDKQLNKNFWGMTDDSSGKGNQQHTQSKSYGSKLGVLHKISR